MEDMEPGEVAAMWQDGEDAIILVTSDRSIPDDERCAAVNRMLAKLKLQPGTPATAPVMRLVGSAAVLSVLLPHLSQQMTSPAGKCLQSLLV